MANENIIYSQMDAVILMLERQVNLMHESLCDMMITCPSFSDQIEECEEAADFMMDTLTSLKEKIKYETNKREADCTPEPIRCKECKYWMAMDYGNGYGKCTGFMANFNTYAHWYCASAKKKSWSTN